MKSLIPFILLILIYSNFSYASLLISSNYNLSVITPNSAEQSVSSNYIMDYIIPESGIVGITNSTNYSMSFGFNYFIDLDTQLPNITIIQPLNNSVLTSNPLLLEINITDNHNVSHCWHSLSYQNGTLIQANTTLLSCSNNTIPFILTDNDYIFTVYANDTTNNLQQKFHNFKKITPPPLVLGGFQFTPRLPFILKCNATQFLFDDICVDISLQDLLNNLTTNFIKSNDILDYKLVSKKNFIKSSEQQILLLNKFHNKYPPTIKINPSLNISINVSCINFIDTNKNQQLDIFESSYTFLREVPLLDNPTYNINLYLTPNMENGQYLIFGMCTYYNETIPSFNSFTVITISDSTFFDRYRLWIISSIVIVIISIIVYWRKVSTNKDVNSIK